MSLYDKMGLLITPNGVAPSKIFAYKPTNGSGDGVFDRNTTATRVNSAGLIEDVAIDVARIDYPTNGSCPHLLFEPQSTNLIPYSEDLIGNGWEYYNTNVTSNQSTSPDGTINADKVTYTSGGFIRRSDVINIGDSFSIFAKMIDLQFIQIMSSADVDHYVNFDIQNGLIGNKGFEVSAEIKDVGNGYYRISMTIESGASNGTFRLYNILSLTSTWAGGSSSAIGSFYFWGGQHEQQSYATSYIPTNGSAVTRVQDVANNFGDVNTFNSAEGVLFVEMAALSDDLTVRYLSLSDGTSANRIYIRFDNVSNRIIANMTVAGGGGSTLLTTSYTITDFNKIAFKYKLNDFALWINGVEVTTSLSGGVFTPNILNSFQFDLGNGVQNLHAKVKQVQVYKEALTDLELEYLTTYGSFTDLANANNYNLILNT